MSNPVFPAVRPALKALLLACLTATPAFASGTFNITSYGAVSSTTTNDTTAITDAIAAAKAAGGGTVLVPAGTYEHNGFTIDSSGITLEVEGKLQALPYGTYSGSTSQIIEITNASNITIDGGGTIDGNGSGWWGKSTRPKLIYFNNCTSVNISSVTVSNSPIEHISFTASDYVTISHVTISAPSTSPNTDGIDPAGSYYNINNCTIADGDDNIAIKAESVACNCITVSGCTFGSGHGLSVGGQTNDGVDNVAVSNCTFNGTQYGLRLKADVGNGGLTQNCTYNTITMTGVQYPIYISSYYGGSYNPPNTNAADNPPVPDGTNYSGDSGIPTWKNILFQNITSTDTTSGSYAGLVWGLPGYEVDGVTFQNVKLTSYYGMIVNYATGVDFTDGSTITVSSGSAFSNPMATTDGSTSITNLYDASITNPP